MHISASDAKNRFGHVCAEAKREPGFVQKAGRIDTVFLSAEQYLALQSGQNLAVRSARKQAFETEYADWIAAQNAWVDAHGIPGEDFRPW